MTYYNLYGFYLAVIFSAIHKHTQLVFYPVQIENDSIGNIQTNTNS